MSGDATLLETCLHCCCSWLFCSARGSSGSPGSIPRGSDWISSRGCRQALVLPALRCGLWDPRHLIPAVKLPGRWWEGWRHALQWVTPRTPSGRGPGAAATAVPPTGSSPPARVFGRSVRLPVLSCASLGKHVSGKGGSWLLALSGTRTLGNLFCASALTPGVGRAPLPLVGLLPAAWGSGQGCRTRRSGRCLGPGPKTGRGEVRLPCPPASPPAPVPGGGCEEEGNVVL